MFRYVAAHWSSGDAQARDAARRVREVLLAEVDYQVALEVHNAWVVATASTACHVYPLHGQGGVVLGTLFKRDDSSFCGPQTFQRAQDAYPLLASRGTRLTRQYWGRYVAFLLDPGAQRLLVLRDPMGGIPCLVTRQREVTFVFSYADDLVRAGALTGNVDWQFVRRWVRRTAGRTQDTGIREVRDLRPGERLCLPATGASERETCWSGIPHAEAASRRNGEDFQAALRDTTRRCVQAWAKRHTRIVHRLSGGFDSSVVLACLPKSPEAPGVDCVNYHDPVSRSGDERAYARLVAERAGVPLRELGEETVLPLDALFRAPRFARPADYQGTLRRWHSERAVIEQYGATAAFSGTGGDQLFFQNPVPLTAADLLVDSGPTPRWLKHSSAVARAQRLSVPRVLSRAVLALFASSRSVPGPSTFFGGDALREGLGEREAKSASTAADAPEVQTIPPAKRSHLRVCEMTPGLYNALGLANYPEPTMPLLSQPLIELCLSIPTYVLARNGVDRGLARAAFADVLPIAIVRRTRKGSIDGYLDRLVAANLAFIRELMLDGHLVRERLLDRGKLEQALAPTSPVQGRHAGEMICRHLNTEIWLRSWCRG